MEDEYEVTPPRFFARVRRVPWAAPTSAEYFCAERVALWRKNGRSKCSREIWVTELRTRGQGEGPARFNDTSGLASFAESPSIKFHPYGYLLSTLRRPSTTTGPPFFSSRPPSSMKRRQPSIRLPEIARPFVSSIDQRRYLDSWKHFEGTVCVTMMMMTSWPFSTTILSFDEWGDGSPVLEQVSSEFGKLESLRSSLHWNYFSDREIEIDFRFILRFKEEEHANMVYKFPTNFLPFATSINE